jgi:hypothetical protein
MKKRRGSAKTHIEKTPMRTIVYPMVGVDYTTRV